MTSDKKDFYGKEVTDAIKNACKELNVPQEQLEIEVVETGSTGIFGLIRKKAHITALVKGTDTKEVETGRKSKKRKVEKPAAEAVEDPSPDKALQEEKVEPPVAEEADTGKKVATEKEDITVVDSGGGEDDIVEEISEAVLDIIKQELTQLLDLMGYSSPMEVSSKGSSVFCHVGQEHEKILTGQDGKTLDSIQYLLRKVVARKVPNRLRLTVDVGNYREKRLDELKVRAAELAEKVKASGKTQVIAALSPSERRVIHMSLQDDKEIRSRSVGDGLFKKILIYKPGKSGKSGKGGTRKRNNSRGRRGPQNNKKIE